MCPRPCGYGDDEGVQKLQLDLPLWPVGSVRAEITAYLKTQTEGLSEFTLLDYEERAKWLYRVLGELRPLVDVTFEVLEAIALEEGRSGTGLANVTIKKRFVFLRAVMTYAAKRRVIALADVPEMPKLRNDGVSRKAFLTVAQFKVFRFSLPPGRFRVLADLAFWTGHHNQDLFTFEWWMLEPEFAWVDDDGGELARGRYWRRNQKNPRCTPVWLPMEPELREIVLELVAENRGAGPKGLITGRVWSFPRAFKAAADRAELPRVSPIDLRRSFATMLASRDYPHEYIRQAMGHEGEDSKIAGGASSRPTILTRHYLRPSPELFTNAIKRRKP